LVHDESGEGRGKEEEEGGEGKEQKKSELDSRMITGRGET
jgi:hypothetical protein